MVFAARRETRPRHQPSDNFVNDITRELYNELLTYAAR